MNREIVSISQTCGITSDGNFEAEGFLERYGNKSQKPFIKIIF